MPRVVVTRALPEAGLRLLRRWKPFVRASELPPSEKDLIRLGAKAEGLLCLLTDPVTRPVVEACPRLRVISTMAVGYDNIDVSACRERGIAVCNTPGVLTETTADLVWALLLAAARRLVEADRFLREGRFKIWSPTLLCGMDVYNKTLGIIGAGGVGRAVARRAAGFDMKVLYTSRTRKPGVGTFCSLESLLRRSDFVAVTCALNERTRHLIDARRLALMKPTAVLVNAARGPIVDEAALTRALRTGRIFAAGLDVYEFEPRVTRELLSLDNVVLLPHIGSASVHTRNRMAEIAAQNLIAVLSGRPPAHRVV